MSYRDLLFYIALAEAEDVYQKEQIEKQARKIKKFKR